MESLGQNQTGFDVSEKKSVGNGSLYGSNATHNNSTTTTQFCSEQSIRDWSCAQATIQRRNSNESQHVRNDVFNQKETMLNEIDNHLTLENKTQPDERDMENRWRLEVGGWRCYFCNQLVAKRKNRHMRKCHEDEIKNLRKEERTLSQINQSRSPISIQVDDSLCKDGNESMKNSSGMQQQNISLSSPKDSTQTNSAPSNDGCKIIESRIKLKMILYEHICYLCNTSFRFFKQIMNHVNRVHNEKQVGCDSCNITFKKNSTGILSWNKHFKDQHFKNTEKDGSLQQVKNKSSGSDIFNQIPCDDYVVYVANVNKEGKIILSSLQLQHQTHANDIKVNERMFTNIITQVIIQQSSHTYSCKLCNISFNCLANLNHHLKRNIVGINLKHDFFDVTLLPLENNHHQPLAGNVDESTFHHSRQHENIVLKSLYARQQSDVDRGILLDLALSSKEMIRNVKNQKEKHITKNKQLKGNDKKTDTTSTSLISNSLNVPNDLSKTSISEKCTSNTEPSNACVVLAGDAIDETTKNIRKVRPKKLTCKKILTCRTCGDNFPSGNQRLKHILSVHRFVCKICSSQFVKKGSLKKGVISFMTELDLNEHIRREHQSSCDKIVNKKKSYEKPHISTSQKMETTETKCPNNVEDIRRNKHRKSKHESHKRHKHNPIKKKDSGPRDTKRAKVVEDLPVTLISIDEEKDLEKEIELSNTKPKNLCIVLDDNDAIDERTNDGTSQKMETTETKCPSTVESIINMESIEPSSNKRNLLKQNNSGPVDTKQAKVAENRPVPLITIDEEKDLEKEVEPVSPNRSNQQVVKKLLLSSGTYGWYLGGNLVVYPVVQKRIIEFKYINGDNIFAQHHEVISNMVHSLSGFGISLNVNQLNNLRTLMPRIDKKWKYLNWKDFLNDHNQNNDTGNYSWDLGDSLYMSFKWGTPDRNVLPGGTASHVEIIKKVERRHDVMHKDKVLMNKYQWLLFKTMFCDECSKVNSQTPC